MTFDAPTFYNCPSCGKTIAKLNYMSFTVLENDLFSDGYNSGYPRFTPNLAKCPYCGALFFLHNLEENEAQTLEEGLEYEYIATPQQEDYINALERGLCKTKDEEREARLCLWRSLNGKVRHNEGAEIQYQRSFTKEEFKLWEDNCKALLSLLKEKLEELNEDDKDNTVYGDLLDEPGDYNEEAADCQTYLMEVQRNLGLFDECLETLSWLPPELEWLKKQFTAKCEAKDRMPFKLKREEDDDSFEHDDTLSEEEKVEKRIERFTMLLNRYGGRDAYLYGRALAYSQKGDLDTALVDINRAIENNANINRINEDTIKDAIEYNTLRADIYSKLGNNEKVEYNRFKVKLLAAYNNACIDASIDAGNDAALSLMETEGDWNIIENSEGDILFCIKERDGEPAQPEILYSGGANALLRRSPFQFIFLESIHESAREILRNKDEVLITESLSLWDEDVEGGMVREYMAKVRLVHESLESVETIIKDGYPLFTSLRALLYVHKDKPLTEIINVEDYTSLMAVLAREEDYEQLERVVSSLQNYWPFGKVSVLFSDWQPTPLYYITSYKVWPLMKDPAKMVRWLVDHGANPNDRAGVGSTPLGNQGAAREAEITGKGFPFLSYDIMKALLEAGANPNAESGEGDGIYLKPIDFVIFPGDLDIETLDFTPIDESEIDRAVLLLEHGAEPEPVTMAQALGYSAGEGRKKLVNLICEKGITIEQGIKALEEQAAGGFPLFYRTLYNLYSEGEFVPKDSAKAQEYLDKFKLKIVYNKD